jgi:DNA-binding protein YbaB
MSTFQDMKKLLQLRKEAKEIQKKLKNIHIEADEGNITVTINAEQNVIKVEIKDDQLEPSMKRKLEDNLVKAFNKGIKKSQSIAAENMKGILGNLGGDLGGLGALTESDKK